MSQWRYLVVCQDGTSYDLNRNAQFMEWGKHREPRFDLQELLSQGWSPLRECAMGGDHHGAYALVVLQKSE